MNRIINLCTGETYLSSRDTEPAMAKFRYKKSGVIVGPSLDQFMASVPHFNFHVRAYDRNKKLYADFEALNGVTREGVGYLIGSAFQISGGALAEKTNFFATQSKSNTAFATTQTASSPVYTEIVYTTDVSQSVRPTITLGSLSTGADLTSCDNSASKAIFSHLTTITVYGASTISVNSGGSSSGYTGDILYGYALYGTALGVQNGYEVDVQVTLSATAG